MTRRSAVQMLAGAAVAGQSPAAPKEFKPTFESLKQYSVPEWFRDAKFGIWAHWGPQSVPEDGDWYARNMYIEGSVQYEYHCRTYGHPSKVGYKDIVQRWKAEDFDAPGLVALYKKVGAKYFVAQAVHHDNFDNWNSKYHRWNAVKIGPHKDIVGLWRDAARSNGLRFGVTEHLERSWSWFNVNKNADKIGPYKGVPYDGNDPKYADFYFPPHEDTSSSYPENPPASWTHEWLNRITDLVDNYQPDLLYTDGGIPFGEIGRRLVAHYYNQSMKWNNGKLEAVYTIKHVKNANHGDYEEGCCLLDLERGIIEGVRADPWQTDTCIGDWFYKREKVYKTPTTIVHMLADIVSRNGNLLLNFPLRPNGVLDFQERWILEELAKWMAMNGEAIYSTRPWKIFGEGPTQSSGGMFSERNFKNYTAEDIRFTTKGETLYAIALGWPGRELAIKSLGESSGNGPAKIGRVEMLGVAEPLKWSRSGAALVVQMPANQPGDYAYALRITS
ncbi:MAG TPA: alpha-L-fucosidase [Bryobacteraceae bacterium]|nr:alpha-L-fucosidase [Bryobacteraceae bacterium]